MVAVQLMIYVILVIDAVGYKGKFSFRSILPHGLRTIATIVATMSLLTTISSDQTHNPSPLNNDSIIFQSISNRSIALSLTQSFNASMNGETSKQLIQSENYFRMENIRNDNQSPSTNINTIDSRLKSLKNDTSKNRFIGRIQHTTNEPRLPLSSVKLSTARTSATSATSLTDNFGHITNISSKPFNEVISTQLMNILERMHDNGNTDNAKMPSMDYSIYKQDHQTNMTKSTKLKQNLSSFDIDKQIEFISKDDTNVTTLLLSSSSAAGVAPMVDDTTEKIELLAMINDKKKILLTKDNEHLNNKSVGEMIKTTPSIEHLNDDSVSAKRGTAVSIPSLISDSRQRMNVVDVVSNFSNQTKTSTNVRQYFKQNAMGNQNQTHAFLFQQMINKTKRTEDWMMKISNRVKMVSTQLSIATGESVQMRKFEYDSGINRSPMPPINVNFRLNSNFEKMATSVQSTRNDDLKTTIQPTNTTSPSTFEINEIFVNMNDDNKRWNDESELDPIDTHMHRNVDRDSIMAYEQSKLSGLSAAEQNKQKMNANKKIFHIKKQTEIEFSAAVPAAIRKFDENKLTKGNNSNNSNGNEFNSSNLANEIDGLTFGSWADDMQSNSNQNDNEINPISLQMNTNSFENKKNQQYYNATMATTQSIINDKISFEEEIMNVTTSGTDKTMNTIISTDGRTASNTNIAINNNDSIDQMTFVTSMPVPFDEHNGISLQYQANETATHVLQITNRKSKRIDEDVLTTGNVHISTVFNGNVQNASFPYQSPIPTAINARLTVNSDIETPLITSFENDTMKRIKRPFNIIPSIESSEAPTISTKLENLILSHTKHSTLDHLTTAVSAENAVNNQFIIDYSNATSPNQHSMINNNNNTVITTWPVKHAAIVEGDVILGGLMMVHSREDSITCGTIMPQGGIQALEVMLYTLDRINEIGLLPNFTLGAHILDDCDKDTYGLEMAVDFIKGKRPLMFFDK